MSMGSSVHETRVCRVHGDYTADGFEVFGRVMFKGCPACTAEMHAREEQKREQDRIQWEQQRLRDVMDATNLPERFKSRTFDSFVAESDEQRRALTIVRDYAEDFPRNLQKGLGLVLAGKPGNGKSHLASAAILKLMDRYSTTYLTCMQMMRAVRDTWRRDSDRSEREVMQMLGSDIDLLVIDEVGVQYGTDGEQTIIFEVLDRRYGNQKPTILLTNQDKAGFKAFVGDRVFDRLVETSRWVPFDWASYRPRARELEQ